MQRDAALASGFPISTSCTNASIDPSRTGSLVDVQSRPTLLTEANLAAHNQQLVNTEHTLQVSIATWIDASPRTQHVVDQELTNSTRQATINKASQTTLPISGWTNG
ncbi:hypothetical protein LTR56_016318 [Elasticomyces elasticus]|nr:hypothetical protein LTR56_016318 [Elasticomyces elasticus]KAK3657706.1 hypothetical protein LTR22_009258 [Elasticomyces elasticus]KAK4922511.1 hypothetical protein LTR49_010211 [Elasticomyces elasticus]KAK5760598.1 hypothetical protein LTS12_009307 [Elasticomyces elasticus]